MGGFLDFWRNIREVSLTGLGCVKDGYKARMGLDLMTALKPGRPVGRPLLQSRSEALVGQGGTRG